MIQALDIFNDVNYLDPRCPGCHGKVDYEITTLFDQNKKVHICKECGTIVD